MHFFCNLVYSTSDDRHFEWSLEICAATVSDAAQLAERHLARMDASGRMEVFSLEIVPPYLEAEKAQRTRNQPGVYSSADPDPREVVMCQSSTLASWVRKIFGSEHHDK